MVLKFAVLLLSLGLALVMGCSSTDSEAPPSQADRPSTSSPDTFRSNLSSASPSVTSTADLPGPEFCHQHTDRESCSAYDGEIDMLPWYRWRAEGCDWYPMGVAGPDEECLRTEHVCLPWPVAEGDEEQWIGLPDEVTIAFLSADPDTVWPAGFSGVRHTVESDEDFEHAPLTETQRELQRNPVNCPSP